MTKKHALSMCLFGLLACSTASIQAQITAPESVNSPDELAQYLQSSIDGYVQEVESVAAEPEVIAALESKDDNRMSLAAGSLTSKLTNSLAVRLYLPNSEAVEYQDNPACGYTCNELVNSAKEKPAAEALFYNTPDAHILLVRRIKNADGNRIGSIAVFYSYDLIKQSKNVLNSLGIPAAIQQAHGNETNALLASRNKEAQKGKPEQSIDIAGTNWRVVSWPASGLSVTNITQQDMSLTSIPVMVGGGITILILLLITFKLLKRKKPKSKMLSEPIDGETDSRERTLVFGGGAKDVDVEDYLKQEDITDIKNKMGP